ncbi:MAG TPA: dodecin family protein, partial [Propionibacteriaceae bacterium]|nr:dodecin family protein [Propionibacteriaceae bacterium]
MLGPQADDSLWCLVRQAATATGSSGHAKTARHDQPPLARVDKRSLIDSITTGWVAAPYDAVRWLPSARECEIITVPNRVNPAHPARRANVSVYRVIDVVGTSTTSWEEAAADAIKTAGQSVRDL